MIVLERFAYTPMGTFGKLALPEFDCYTVERPWHDNAPRKSCIPVGTYPLERGRYHRGNYDAYEVLNVPNRSLIKIHIANTMADVLGCIGPGLKLGWVNDTWAVTFSRPAFERFMLALDQLEAPTLTITNLQAGDWSGPD